MYATVLDFAFKPESRDEAIALIDKIMDEIGGQVEGLRGFVAVDRGDNRGTAIVIYESKEHWEAAASVSAEVLGQLAPHFSEMPERQGCEVTNAKRFV